MDKCREEFEVWFKEYCEKSGTQCHLKVMVIGCYLSSFTEACFCSWKASRESMKAIKLPELPITMPIDYRIGFADAVNRCEDEITQAGYKVE